jgi:copper transport protein
MKLLAFPVFIAIGMTPRAALAHAKVVSSSPANAGHLASPPASIRITFSEPPVLAMSRVSIALANGMESILQATVDPADPHTLVAVPPPLESGSYTVTWRVVPADGHAASGKISFEVDDRAATIPMAVDSAHAPAAVTTSPFALLPALFRGLALSCLLAACGLLGFTAYSDSTRQHSQRRLICWLLAAATILFVAHLIAWIQYISPGSLDREFVEASLRTSNGKDELIRLVLCALAALTAILAGRDKAAFALALAAVIAGGVMGHPAAHHPAAAIPLKALHLVGVAFWMGGVLWLITNRDESIEAASSVSRVAIVSISIVALSGVIETVLFVDAFAEPIGLAYATLVLAKVAGLVVLGAFGTYHRNMIKRGTVGAPFTRSLKRETVVMIAIVMIAGFLAYVPVS